MQTQLLWAAIVAILVGLVHSVLGEILIFRRMRQGGVVPTEGQPVLRERHVRILWASWHLVTILGWALAAILLMLAASAGEPLAKTALARVVIGALLTGSALVLFATRGRHPGWLALLIAAVLGWLGHSGA
jgi:hypothetical protein